MIATALVVLSFILPIAVIISYCVGIKHGRDLERRKIPEVPTAIDKVMQIIKPDPVGTSYVPGRDPSRQFDGEEEDQFSNDEDEEQFDYPKEPA